MKAKNIAILLFSAVIGCAVAKTYSSLQEEGGKTTDVRKERKTNVTKDVVSESEPTVEHETESVQAEVAKPSYGEYASLQKSGVVGLYGGNSIDNPEDNIFEVVIPSSFSSSDKVVLSYDVEGVAGSTGVALSINDRTAMGGMVAYSSDKRSSVSEEIDAAWLVKGKNRIMFTLPDSANYGYRVSNLKIAISANTASGNIVATASKLDGEVYVRGFVKNAKAKSVNIAGKEYELTHGSFEALISGDDENVRITCGDASKTFHATTVPGCIASTRLICVNKSEKQTQKEFSLAKKENNKVQDVAATLNVDSGVVKKDMKITMTNLRHKDLPALDLGMTNVTDGVEGYRFLPHGAHFDGEGAVVSLKYDRTKIPSGYTENDIRTYYFDLDTKHWVALKRDSIDKENNLIVSRTNHFTDMINGVIQAPESPETQGFTPTMMSDLKLADPTAKIQSIAPPTANNRGSANLSYSFEMPPARHGMQPSLGIQYNSDGGTGLLGEGWDLSVPTISVETRWGVPRYDDILETETYLMDGSMLVLDNGGVNYLAHRALNQIKRSEVKRTDGAVIFHPRKEGSFSKIVRLGNSPAEYTWVVTDKSGTKYYYGKKNADGSMKGVLMGKNHEGKDVIAEWKLVRIQEVHGDWVEYEYETKDETVLGNVTAKTLYLSKITAGNSGEKAHTEVAISYSDKVVENPKITTNGRFGFLTAQTKYLNGVIVKYDNEYLRSYGFEYDKSASGAVLLKSVKHLYNNETISENKFEYNDLNLTFGSEKSHSASGESGKLLSQIKNGFDGHLSMINGAKTLPGTFSVGGGANAGIGPAYAGANYSFSRNESAGKVTLIDINGDGIPDKVYIDGDVLKYCAGNINGDFEQAEKIEHDFKKSRFSLSKSTSHTVGADVGIGSGWASIGANFSHSWENSQTKVWFQDFNSDGLVDVAYEGKVFFNRLVNGKPYFKASSDETPNRVVATDNFPTGGALKETTEEEKIKIKDSLEKAMPMYDAVRVWKAPFSGSVKVSAEIEVGEYTGDPKYSDDLNFVLQVGETVEVSKKLTYKQKHTLPEKTYNVSAGTMIFFRVNSVYHGVCDMIKCDPVIEYTTLSNVEELDENGLSNKIYKASEDFVDGGSDTIVFVGPGSVYVKNTIDIYREIKDTAVLEIKGISKLGKSIIWTDTIIGREEHLDGQFKVNGEIFSFNGESQDDTLKVTVNIKSDVQIDHKAFDWKCEFSTNNDKDPDIVAPNRTMYNYIKKETVAKTIEFDDNLEYVDEFATLKFDVTEYEDKNPVFVIFAGENRIKTDAKPLKLNVEELAGKEVKIIMYSDSVEQTSQYIANISRDYKETITNELGEEETIVKTLTIPVSMSVRTIVDPQQLVLGRYYRGWGQFAYKSSPDCKKIELDKLTIQSNLSEEEINEMSNDKGDYDEETRSSKTLQNINKVENKDQLCFPLSYDSKENRYVGVTPSIYVGADKMQSSRFGDGCINLDDEIVSYSTPLLGGELMAPILMTKSQTNSGTVTGGASVGKFGIGANGSYSSTTIQTETAAIDLNGDGYPDWISKDEDHDKMTVQYTNENGGLSKGDVWFTFKPQEQKSTATAGGISASLSEKPGKGGAFSAVFTKGMWSKSNLQSMAEADHHATRSASASGNLSKAESNSLSEWYDINGDGLPDLVYDNGNVKLNLGYAFVDATFEKTDIYKAETFTKAAGVGVTIPLKGSASIGAGVNGTMSNTSLLSQLCDVNGDGLPDKVENKDNGTLKVHFNTGSGFDSKEHTMSCAAGIYLNKSTSVSVMPHVNGGFTFRIGFVSVTPFFTGSVVSDPLHGTINRTVRAFSDFDCDGFPDILQSDDANELKVYSSQMGCVDKLKSVTTPFGGKYELEYIHSTPTQQHPGGKWVMSKLTVTDTQRDINDCPPVVSVFDYAGGKRDRRERDFYGFAEVRTKRMNVNDEGKSVVESQIVQNYDTTNYYTSGTTIGSYVCDADQKQFFSKETTKLKMYDVSGKGNVTNGREVSATASFDENGRYFVAPFESTTKRFEEDSEITTNIVENKYGNFGNLTEYKYTDGITNASYTTTIQYKDYDEETGVFGLPIDVVVKSGDQTMRHVSAEYDMLDNNKESGYNPTSMTKMTQYLDKNTTATIEFKYDTLGNIIEKIMPKVNDESNLMKERMKYTYEYDKKYRMYPIRVTDGFGYRSDMFNYDYRYGIPLSVKDMNGFITEYEIDDLGRVTKVTAPNELSSGAPYTIKYEYFSGDKIRMAKTYHYDPQHEDQAMITVNLVDGFGRELQARKSAEIDGDDKFMIVSGKTTFDALGRELSHYAPTTCLKSEMENLTCNFSDLKLDLTTYDAFDRPNEKTVYDEKGTPYVTKMEYSIDDDKLKTTVTDAEGMVADAYTDGTEHTLKTVKKHENGEDPATTKFDFDGIGQLLSVKDPADKLTTYTYDMAGRKLSVANPSAGKTTFTYDNLGNVLTKTTGKGDVVTYKYEYNRLVEQIYGNDKWKNNVKYTYGGVDAKHNRVGRLALVEDGSGAQEYFYGKMGEVEKIRRTIIIPGIDVATYTTEWKYDSWNRIQEMIYPDGEKIKYYYNLGGQLKKILGQKNYICTYIDSIRYDKYEQRSYIKYGNGTETTYDYDNRIRRLKNMTVANKDGQKFLENSYLYDKVNNITKVENTAALNAGIGGTMTHEYKYDDWYRLIKATGKFVGSDNKSADYHLEMGYDNLYNITSKKLTMTQTNLQFAGTLSAGHEFSYNYSTGNPMQLASVETKQYNVDGEVSDVDAKLADNQHVQNYEFDANGNMTSVSVASLKPETQEPETTEASEEKDILKSFLWDEENRLLAVNNNGSVSCYFYDAAGERTVKLTSETEMVHVNGKKVGGNDAVTKFTAYVSPYFVVSNGGAYTKHIYAANQRIASKLGNEDGFGADPRRVEMAGGKKISDIQKDNIGARFSELGFTYTAPEKEKVEKDSSMDSEAEEKLIFFYHPDHLGSTSYVTDADGNIAQHIEYIPYGEVFVEERNNSFSTNYLFNAKELDNETGLYYYGARYLDPTGAMWLSVDPLYEKNISATPYNYCLNNPVVILDPDGRDYVYFKEDGTEIGHIANDNVEKWYVVRTTQSTKEMYKESSSTQKGFTNPISKMDALRAEIKAIMACNGKSSQDDIPMHLFTEIPNKESADASFEFIRDDGKAGTSDNNNREYSFNVLKDYDDRNVYLGLRAEGDAGPVMDPSESTVLPAGGHRENHSHSSGVKVVGGKVYSWQQPPSKGDIENCGRGFVGNVWGMRSKTLYIYDKSGVKATVPFSIYGR